jgi:hypothetical protein
MTTFPTLYNVWNHDTASTSAPTLVMVAPLTTIQKFFELSEVEVAAIENSANRAAVNVPGRNGTTDEVLVMRSLLKLTEQGFKLREK